MPGMPMQRLDGSRDVTGLPNLYRSSGLYEVCFRDETRYAVFRAKLSPSVWVLFTLDGAPYRVFLSYTTALQYAQAVMAADVAR